MLTLLRSLVINKLDSCSSVTAGAPDVLLRRLQSVLNADVWLVFSARKFDHTTPLLCELHWLKVPQRVRFRLCVLAYRCLTGTAPHYLAETICPVSSRGTCQHLCSAETSTLLFAIHASFDSQWSVILSGSRTGIERPTTTRSECALSSHLPPRTEDRSVPLVVPWRYMTMYCALSARPSYSADLSPCTGCYKLILLTLYGGHAAAVR